MFQTLYHAHTQRSQIAFERFAIRVSARLADGCQSNW